MQRTNLIDCVALSNKSSFHCTITNCQAVSSFHSQRMKQRIPHNSSHLKLKLKSKPCCILQFHWPLSLNTKWSGLDNSILHHYSSWPALLRSRTESLRCVWVINVINMMLHHMAVFVFFLVVDFIGNDHSGLTTILPKKQEWWDDFECTNKSYSRQPGVLLTKQDLHSLLVVDDNYCILKHRPTGLTF